MKISDKDFISGLWNKQKQKWVQWVHRSLSDNHCPECLKLDGGYFFKTNAPKHPHHPYCHCLLKPISYNTVLKNAKAVSAYSKFDPYLFNVDEQFKHKKHLLFKKWGYDVTDSNGIFYYRLDAISKWRNQIKYTL